MRAEMTLASTQPVGKAWMGVRRAVAVAGVGLFFTDLVDYGFLAHGTPKPLYWVLALVAASGALTVIDPERSLPLLRSPFFAWILFYAFVTFAWALGAGGGDPRVMDALDERVRAIGFLVAFALLLDDAAVRRAALLAVAGAALLATCLNLAEVAGLVQFEGGDAIKRIAGRAAGFYVNPNESALAITFAVAIAAPALRVRWRIPLLVVSGVGVAATFSRSAALLYAVLLAWLTVRKRDSVAPLAVVALLLLAAATIGADQLMGYLDQRGVLNEDTLSRLDMSADDSGRTELAIEGWRRFEAAPIVGHGLGYASDVANGQGAHNSYLTLAIQHGILGLLTFPALIAALLATSRRVTAVPLLLAAAGLFSHNALSHPFLLVAIAFTGTHPTGLRGDEA